MRKYKLIRFLADNKNAGVPKRWIVKSKNGYQCYWPMYGLNQKIRLCVPPPLEVDVQERKKWKLLDCVVISKKEYNSYETADGAISLASEFEGGIVDGESTRLEQPLISSTTDHLEAGFDHAPMVDEDNCVGGSPPLLSQNAEEADGMMNHLEAGFGHATMLDEDNFVGGAASLLLQNAEDANGIMNNLEAGFAIDNCVGAAESADVIAYHLELGLDHTPQSEIYDSCVGAAAEELINGLASLLSPNAEDDDGTIDKEMIANLLSRFELMDLGYDNKPDYDILLKGLQSPEVFNGLLKKYLGIYARSDEPETFVELMLHMTFDDSLREKIAFRNYPKKINVDKTLLLECWKAAVQEKYKMDEASARQTIFDQCTRIKNRKSQKKSRIQKKLNQN